MPPDRLWLLIPLDWRTWAALRDVFPDMQTRMALLSPLEPPASKMALSHGGTSCPVMSFTTSPGSCHLHGALRDA